ncbi:acyl-CoA dehydrogenase [Streptomyces sp. NPDC051173]|uniref:acyl-CoA dehydrogenase family protein n=1 Tax=Streptomyces sp. NPDC051173 TaxID=3155164 RepID=UPI00344D577E
MRHLLHGDRLRHLTRLDRLLDRPCFDRTPLTGSAGARHEQTYSRLRALGLDAGGSLALHRDRSRLLTALEWAATVDPGLFLTALVHFSVVTCTLAELGRPGEHLASLTEDLDRMDAVGGILITELGNGSSHLAPATEARYHHTSRTFTLHTPDPEAAKFMAPAGSSGRSRIAVVYAGLLVDDRAQGVFPFAVRLRHGATTAPGVRITPLPPTSLVPLDYAVISFDGTPVPYDGWLRDSADITDAGRFEDPLGGSGHRLVRSLLASAHASVGAATGQAAAARAAVAIALRYSGGRTTMGRLAPKLPVLEYRTQQEALYSALARAYAATFLVNEERERFARGAHSRPPAAGDTPPTWAPWSAAHRDLALAKAWTSRTLEQVAAVCRQRCGAQGVLSMNRITDYEDLARIFHAAAGDTLLIHLDAGKSLLAEPAPPAAGLPTGPFDVADPGTAVSLARLRESRLHTDLARRLDETSSADSGPRRHASDEFAVWNPLLPGLVDLAVAHTKRVVLERFHHQAAALTGSPDEPALAALHQLLSLDSIEEDLGWHLEHSDLTPDEGRLVHSARPRALAGVHAHLPALIDTLALPPARLGAPIGQPNWLQAVLDSAHHVGH